jgi:hypothetical protein
MAAHPKTAMEVEKKMIDTGQRIPDETFWGTLRAALDLSWTEDLDEPDRRLLDRIVQSRDFTAYQQFLAELLPKYTRIWESYGQPRTREEWCFRRYTAFCSQFGRPIEPEYLAVARRNGWEIPVEITESIGH